MAPGPQGSQWVGTFGDGGAVASHTATSPWCQIPKPWGTGWGPGHTPFYSPCSWIRARHAPLPPVRRLRLGHAPFPCGAKPVSNSLTWPDCTLPYCLEHWIGSSGWIHPMNGLSIVHPAQGRKKVRHHWIKVFQLQPSKLRHPKSLGILENLDFLNIKYDILNTIYTQY